MRQATLDAGLGLGQGEAEVELAVLVHAVGAVHRAVRARGDAPGLAHEVVVRDHCRVEADVQAAAGDVGRDALDAGHAGQRLRELEDALLALGPAREQHRQVELLGRHGPASRLESLRPAREAGPRPSP